MLPVGTRKEYDRIRDQGMLQHIVGEGVSALITLLYSLILYGSASLGSLKLRADSTIPPFYGTLAQASLL
eukprot:scaffold29388_cov54-Attheya_sp.AAC.3